MGPTPLQLGCGEAVFQNLAQDQRQERAKFVAADGGVCLAIDRSGVEYRLGRPEDILHREKLAIAKHDGERGADVCWSAARWRAQIAHTVSRTRLVSTRVAADDVASLAVTYLLGLQLGVKGARGEG